MSEHANTTEKGKPLRLLLCEDSPFDAKLLLARVAAAGYDLHAHRVQTPEDLRTALAAEPWDVILSDHRMPNFTSTDALAILHENPQLDIPFLIVSGSIGEELAVMSMKAGASDYIIKDNLARLIPALERELRDAADRRLRRRAEQDLLANREQMRIARSIQQRLFPQSAPVLPPYEIAGATRPADDTGGDYYDFIPLPGPALAAVIGDVTGHGIGAALLMADTRIALRALALGGCKSGDIFHRTDQLLRDDFGTEHFVTLLYLHLDPAAHTLTYLNAGHPPAYILAPDGTIAHTLKALTPALCLDGIEPTPQTPIALPIPPGHTAILLTDGILETTNQTGEEFGDQRVLELIHANRHRPAAAIVHTLIDAVLTYARPNAPQDDITTIIIRHPGP